MPNENARVLIIRPLGKRSSIASGVIVRRFEDFFSVLLDNHSKRGRPLVLTLGYHHFLHNFDEKPIKL